MMISGNEVFERIPGRNIRSPLSNENIKEINLDLMYVDTNEAI